MRLVRNVVSDVARHEENKTSEGKKKTLEKCHYIYIVRDKHL